MKKADQNIIKAVRGEEVRYFSPDQFAYMEQTGSTYGWKKVIETPAEVQNIEPKIEKVEDPLPEVATTDTPGEDATNGTPGESTEGSVVDEKAEPAGQKPAKGNGKKGVNQKNANGKAAGDKADQ